MLRTFFSFWSPQFLTLYSNVFVKSTLFLFKKKQAILRLFRRGGDDGRRLLRTLTAWQPKANGFQYPPAHLKTKKLATGKFFHVFSPLRVQLPTNFNAKKYNRTLRIGYIFCTSVTVLLSPLFLPVFMRFWKVLPLSVPKHNLCLFVCFIVSYF